LFAAADPCLSVDPVAGVAALAVEPRSSARHRRVGLNRPRCLDFAAAYPDLTTAGRVGGGVAGSARALPPPASAQGGRPHIVNEPRVMEMSAFRSDGPAGPTPGTNPVTGPLLALVRVVRFAAEDGERAPATGKDDEGDQWRMHSCP